MTKIEMLQFIKDFHQFMLNEYDGKNFAKSLPDAVNKFGSNIYTDVLLSMDDSGCIAKSVVTECEKRLSA